MITPSEEEAIKEEQKISNIPWLVDGLNEDDDSVATEGVKFQSGVNFNFDEEVSIKTTQESGNSDITSPLSNNDSSRRTRSILRTDSNTVTSDITTDLRVKCLETGLERIFKFIEDSSNPKQTPPPQSVRTDTGATNLANYQDTKDKIPPHSSLGEGGA